MPRRLAAEERISAIVKAAIEVFSREGFRQAQMREIATIAGVSNGTLYHYFKSKEHLFLYVLENGKVEPGPEMTSPNASSARREEELLELVKEGLARETRIESIDRALATAPDEIDLTAEITEIFGDMWDTMEQKHVQIAILEKSANEFPEMLNVYETYGRNSLLKQLEVYLSTRIQQEIIRPLNSVRGKAVTIIESLSFFAWKQFYEEPDASYPRSEILPDLVGTFVGGLKK